jgi:hypothetical protein
MNLPKKLGKTEKSILQTIMTYGAEDNWMFGTKIQPEPGRRSNIVDACDRLVERGYAEVIKRDPATLFQDEHYTRIIQLKAKYRAWFIMSGEVKEIQ